VHSISKTFVFSSPIERSYTSFTCLSGESTRQAQRTSLATSPVRNSSTVP
jgi:hypothetical protein